jgi:hypothetical protein
VSSGALFATDWEEAAAAVAAEEEAADMTVSAITVAVVDVIIMYPEHMTMKPTASNHHARALLALYALSLHDNGEDEPPRGEGTWRKDHPSRGLSCSASLIRHEFPFCQISQIFMSCKLGLSANGMLWRPGLRIRQAKQDRSSQELLSLLLARSDCTVFVLRRDFNEKAHVHLSADRKPKLLHF